MIPRDAYKPWEDRETLSWAYHDKGLSSREVGSLLGCSKGPILRKLDEFELKKRPGPRKSGPWKNASILQKRYIDDGCSINELAEEWGISNSTVWNWLNEHDIDTRESGGRSGEDHWNWKGDDAGPKSRVCPECGDEFTPDYQDARVEYCSRECVAESLSERVSLECVECGSTFEVRPSRKDQATFCSVECFSNGVRGEGHWRWKGGPPVYGKGWNEAKREQVRERDGYECVACGMSNNDHKVNYDESLHVHHVTPAREFDDAKKRNDPDNLITLCSRCHRRYEGIPIEVIA